MSRFISVVIALAVCFTVTASACSASYVSHLLDTGSWSNAWAMDINNSGQIVGCASGNNKSYAAIWSSDTSGPQLINTGETDRGSFAFWINNSGMVTGTHDMSNGSSVLFQWTAAGGVAAELSFPYDGTVKGSKNAVNDNGYAVGAGDGERSRATLWHGSDATDIGTFGGTWSSAIAINNNNIVSGVYGGDNGAIGNFVWSLNGETIFIPINSSFDSCGLFGIADINDNGVVLGNTEINGVDTVITWSIAEGYTIVGAGIGYAINNSNIIVGLTSEDTGIAKGIVWTQTQVPEPSSILALICGIGSLAGYTVHRKKKQLRRL
ncbi:MAG: PEP-CTERM sorting domain-containing protein [Armatimonadota bacterium]